MTRDQRGRSHDRRGRFTAERTTTTVTERLTVEDGDTLTALPADDGDYGGDVHGWAEGTIPGAIHRASGWDTAAITHSERQLQRAQRKTQQERAEELISDWFASVSPPPGTPLPQWVKDATANMLRAGPHATPLQLKWGRDI
jgi:hypothetical protein